MCTIYATKIYYISYITWQPFATQLTLVLLINIQTFLPVCTQSGLKKVLNQVLRGPNHASIRSSEVPNWPQSGPQRSQSCLNQVLRGPKQASIRSSEVPIRPQSGPQRSQSSINQVLRGPKQASTRSLEVAFRPQSGLQRSHSGINQAPIRTNTGLHPTSNRPIQASILPQRSPNLVLNQAPIRSHSGLNQVLKQVPIRPQSC